MAKFDDTPAHRRATVWNASLQRMVYPASAKQLKLVRTLAREVGWDVSAPRSMDEAKSVIDRMLAEKRRRARG